MLVYLSGLTCNHENFITKGCAIEYAAKQNVFGLSDTSPRDRVPDAPDTDDCKWDFGIGAGFYVDATQAFTMSTTNVFIHCEGASGCRGCYE